MVKVSSIELHSYYENTLPTSKYKLIVFTIIDFSFRTAIDVTPDGRVVFSGSLYPNNGIIININTTK